MKKIVLTINLITLSILAFSQSNCVNLDFEDGDFTNWTLTMGSACGSSTTCYTNPAIGTNSTAPINDQRHVLFNSASYDADAQSINVLCPFTNSYSTRLGNYSAGLGAEETFRQFQLGANDTILKFYYAYVTSEPGHSPNDNPFFLVEILDSVGNPFVPAIDFYLSSSDSSLDTIPSSYFRYKNWSTLNIDVSAVKGREIRIRVLNSDCNFGGHEGRVYFDISCNVNTTSINETNIKTGFGVFPNPTNRNINISTQNKGKVYFYSIKGDLLNIYSVPKGITEFDLNYKKGIYFVKFVSVEGTIKTRKIQIID